MRRKPLLERKALLKQVLPRNSLRAIASTSKRKGPRFSKRPSRLDLKA
jgi:hypothetical protein